MTFLDSKCKADDLVCVGYAVTSRQGGLHVGGGSGDGGRVGWGGVGVVVVEARGVCGVGGWWYSGVVVVVVVVVVVMEAGACSVGGSW